MEQLAARQRIIGNRAIVEAVQKLYYDATKGTFRKGTAGRNRPGTVDRLVAVVQQLECTFDLHTMSGGRIMGMLPPEFDKWKAAQKGKVKKKH